MQKRKTRDGRAMPDGVSERADGRFIYRHNIIGKTQYLYSNDLSDLKSKILESKLNIASGVNNEMSKLSLGSWYTQYIEVYKKGKVKESTLYNYKHYYKWYIMDSLIDRMPMKDLKRTHVVAHFQYLADKKGLASGTLKALASMLFNCLQQVVYAGEIMMNPATDVMKEVTATAKVMREALSQEETKVLIDFLKIDGTWQNIYLPAVGIGLSTGLRFGELYGLVYKSLDFKNHIINIDHTINYRDRGNGKHEYFITSPKTVNSIRQFPMTEEIEKLFKIQQNYQKQLSIRNDITIDGYKDFVFTTKQGTPFTHESVIRSLKLIIKQANEWEQLRAKAEHREPVVVPIHTPHYWRHTFTTRLVEKEVPYETLKVLLGHSSIKTSIDIYTHISQQNLKRVRTDLNGLINIF